MKTISIARFTILATAVFAYAGIANGQITINLPKIPKIPRVKQDPKTPEPVDNTIKTTNTQTTGRETETTTTRTGSDCGSDAVVSIFLKDIETTTKQAEEYRPGLRSYYVQDFSDRQNIYLKASLSPSRKQEWLGTWPAATVNCITPALNNLSAVAKKTLPNYRPSGYALGTPAELKILRSGVNDLAGAEVFKVGIDSPNWMISKDNYNFPTARYKYGMIWAKYPDTDDGFCRIIFVNLVQDYAGGGTYGASYANFIKSEFAGCPPGK